MRPSLLVLAILLLASSAAPQGPATNPSGGSAKKDECSLEGMVVTLAGGAPLRKAKVRLLNTEEQNRNITTVSDASGRFELKGIHPGRYRLTVERSGFVTQEYGQRKPDSPGAMLTLGPGQQLKDLVFRLMPSAVIAGRILDEDGEAMSAVTVSAVREAYADGKKNLTIAVTADTNDLGEYRLFGLAPGRYFVTAVEPGWNRSGDDAESAESAQQSYAKLYYPGTPDATKATSLAIKAGEEIPSIDILMRPVAAHRIRGHVYNQITHKAGVDTNIILTTKRTGPEWDPGYRQTNAQKDASFEIPGVVPGTYMLTAFWSDDGDGGKTYSTRLTVDVSNADVEGLAITIGPGAPVSGRIIWNGKPSLEKDELTVTADPADMGMMFFQNSARVTPNGEFTLKDISEGTYNAHVYGQSKDCYIKDVQYAGSNALEQGFTVGPGTPAALEITMSSRGARVQGAVSDADGLPAVGVWAVLVPDMAHRAQHRLYKGEQTDQYGHFDLRGIPPGDYKVFSWEDVEAEAWEDPEFLKPFEDKGEKISLQDGDSKSAAVVAIKTASTEPQKP